MHAQKLAVLASTPFLLLQVLLVFADVKFTNPAAGAILPGISTLSISWTESGESPILAELVSYMLFLCAGGNDDADIVQLHSIARRGVFENGNEMQAIISSDIGASIPENAYFLKMISTTESGSTVTNYSPRFTLTNMTGTFPAKALQGLETLGSGSTAGPTREVEVRGMLELRALGAGGLFATPFAQQTGLIRYAAMQSYPPTKITKSSKTPLYPPSPYTIATTFLPMATIQTTITEPISWTFAQRENPNPAAPQPTDDMQKYLMRWRD